MQWGSELAEMCPLRQGLEMVHRFAGFDLDDPLQPVAAFRRRQYQVGVHRRRPDADRRVLLRAWVHARFILTAPFALQQADNPVVLELFAHRTDQDRAHLCLQTTEKRNKTLKSSMDSPSSASRDRSQRAC